MSYLKTSPAELVREALENFPRPDQQAQALLKDWLSERGVTTSPTDIEVVTLHYQSARNAGSPALQGDHAVVSQKMNLVQALLSNWQGEPAEGYHGFHYGNWAGMAPSSTVRLVDHLHTPGAPSNFSEYLVFNGLYLRKAIAEYGPATQIGIRAEDFQSFIWGLHFHQRFKQALDDYWKHHLALYQRALKISLIAACNKQVEQGSLSEQGRRLAWQALGLIRQRGTPLQASMLNVYGYSATSILYLKHADSDFTLLYLPGNASPLHEFTDQSAMKQWFAKQCQDPTRRHALLDCFARADWPDGLDFSGLDTALQGLGVYPNAHRLSSNASGFATSGLWQPNEMINYKVARYSPPIQGDLFQHLAQRYKYRSYQDADSRIITNHQVNKSKWGSYLDVAMGLLAPLVLVVPELAPLLVVGGLAQFSLGLDQVINGKTLQEKAEGVASQTFGLFNALPAATNILARSDAIFRYSRPGFHLSPRLREVLGDAPIPNPSSPVELELQPAELAFRDDPRLVGTPGAPVSTYINAQFTPRFSAILEEPQGPVSASVYYDLESDSFIRSDDLTLVNPPRWVTNSTTPTALVRRTSGRLVTDQQRMRSLRRLGIALHLPIDLAAYDKVARQPIPRLISSIWVGDRVIGEEFLAALEHNAHVLANSNYRYQLYLSRMNPSVFRQNRTLLTAKAPTLIIKPLESEKFYQDFSRSPYFAQYQAAINGNGGAATNFSSASDILRYRLLNETGGLYIDADDRLLQTESLKGPENRLDQLELRASAQELLLAPPVSNEQLGMYFKYNNSLLGSHPANPTLDAISQEILERFAQDPTFYDVRPDPDLEPMAFNAYARRLSRLTGPHVLNDIIDQELPSLRQLRELCVLVISPLRDLHQALDLSEFVNVVHTRLPLGRIAEIGHAHSWRTT
ncbi:dermonecrotic toxin domain-containing protein [Pseudomonas sp. xss_2]|uniref:dermonecrotic toxin domain-containing protein n=1 Tax=Pseudomonas sp. xss_2 TaxID=3367215 RepID=UPI00370A3B3A